MCEESKNWLGFIVLATLLIGGLYLISERYPSMSSSFKCRATLISSQINTTQLGSLVYITTWDCGKYGILASDYQRVFRWQKKEGIVTVRWATIVNVEGE